MTRAFRTRLAAFAFVTSVLSGAGLSPAASRDVVGAPPVRMAQQDDGDQQPGGDAAGLVVRLGRLEEQIRTLTGQVEQLQYRNQKLEDALRKMQADTDFRFQDLQRTGTGGSAPAPAALPRPVAPIQKRSDTGAGDATPLAESTATPATGTMPVDTARPAVTARRSTTGDAFDPDANPDAPGAPKPLGTTAPSQPLPPRAARISAADDTRAPLDLMRGRPTSPTPDATDNAAPAVIAAPPDSARDPGAVASLAPGGTREEFDADVGLYKQGQYDNAARGFAAFAAKYPRDRLVPDAVYLTGESYARLGRHREAAEQFLKISTDYGKSARAPEALLRLGVSLSALGAKEQACATYQEVTRRYPTASPDVRAGVDRELKRARCPGNG